MPDWMGVTDAAVDRAREVAGDDYVVLVADVYGTGVRPKNAEEAGKLAGGLKGDRPALRARVRKAVEVLKAQAGNQADGQGVVGLELGEPASAATLIYQL